MADILKKLAAVVFLTMLIWAWAYLELEETMEQQNGTLDISPGIPQELFVSFESQPTPVSLKLTIEGPPSQIAELKKRLRASDADPKKERLDFLYDPASQNHSAPGSYDLNVVEFLNKSDKLKDMAVSVVSCEPSAINVNVEKLTKKWLTVQCLDEDKALLADASVEPASIQMFAPDNWTGAAIVILTKTEIEKARRGPVTERPFIELTPEKRRRYKDTVSITLPATENPLQDRVTNPLMKLGYIFSRNLHGKYTVDLTNENDLRTLQYKASEQAFKAYEKKPYQMLIEIRDGDENAENDVHRQIIYNFPEEFVQKGEIELTGPPREAVFKLVAVSAKPE